MAEAAAQAPEQFPVKLTIERATLLKSLSRLQSIVEKRNTIAILSNIKLDASGDKLQLTATDMDLVATEAVEANIEGGGSLTVPAGTLYDIVRKLPDGAQIELDTDAASTQLVVRAGSSEFRLSYLPADEFPVMSEGELPHNFTIGSATLGGMIDKTRFAMSNEETRYYLNGVYFHITDNASGQQMLKTVATDGHRLALLETSVPSGAESIPGVIIPRKTVNEITRILSETEGTVEVSLSDSKIRFAIDNIVILSKLIDGTFPDYSRVIPQNNPHAMEVATDTLSQAVDRVSTISTEKTRGIKFTLASGKLTLEAKSAEAGRATEDLGVSYEGAAFDIGFNARYVLDMLSQLEGDTVRFQFNDTNSPALVSDPTDVSALYVIMPMRV